MTIAPERIEIVEDPNVPIGGPWPSFDFDCWPEQVKPVSEVEKPEQPETIFADAKDLREDIWDGFSETTMNAFRQAALHGAVTYSVDGTGAPKVVTDAPESGTSATWTHTLPSSSAYVMAIDIAHGAAYISQLGPEGDHVIQPQGYSTAPFIETTQPMPKLTPEDLYDAVRETQREECTGWSDMLQWICECTPSRGQMFGAYRPQEPRTHSERVWDDVYAVQAADGTLEERCGQSVGLFQQQATQWAPTSVQEDTYATWARILSQLFT